MITWLSAETSPVIALLLAFTKSAVWAMAPEIGPLRVKAEARARWLPILRIEEEEFMAEVRWVGIRSRLTD